MSNQEPIDTEQSVPAGFDAETWAKLTPEQQQAYSQPQAGSPANLQAAQAQAQADAMVRETKKKVWYMMIFGVITGLVSRIVLGLFRRGSGD